MVAHRCCRRDESREGSNLPSQSAQGELPHEVGPPLRILEARQRPLEQPHPQGLDHPPVTKFACQDVMVLQAPQTQTSLLLHSKHCSQGSLHAFWLCSTGCRQPAWLPDH